MCSIDFGASNYRYCSTFVLFYIDYFFFYIHYFFSESGFRGKYSPKSCTTDVAYNFVGVMNNYLTVLFQLLFFVTPFILMGSFGNSIEGRKKILRLILCFLLFFVYYFPF